MIYFQSYILSMIEPLFSSLGMKELEDEDLQIRLLRVEIVKWACHLKHKTCIKEAIRLFHQWMRNPNNNKYVQIVNKYFK